MSDDERDQRIDRMLDILERLLPTLERLLKHPMLKRYTGGK